MYMSREKQSSGALSVYVKRKAVFWSTLCICLEKSCLLEQCLYMSTEKLSSGAVSVYV